MNSCTDMSDRNKHTFNNKKMDSQENEQFGNTVRITQDKIQQKQYAYSLAEAEYNKLFSQTEKYSKIVDEIKEKKFCRENVVKTRECRILEFEKAEKELEKEVKAGKKLVADLKVLTLDLQKAKQNEELFNQEVMQLVEKLCCEREVYSKNSLNEELQGSYEETNACDQELIDLSSLIKKLKTNSPIFAPNQELLIKNCVQQMPFLKAEIEKERLGNLEFESKKRIYETTKYSLLCEIQKMEEQL